MIVMHLQPMRDSLMYSKYVEYVFMLAWVVSVDDFVH